MNISSTTSTNYTNPYNVYKYYTRIGGLASGLDTDSIIQGLMSIQKARYNKLYQQHQLLQWQREDYMNMAKEISSFKDYIFNLKLSSNFVKFKATGPAIDGGYINVTGTANALEGNYEITINSIAKPSTMVLSNISATFDRLKSNNISTLYVNISTQTDADINTFDYVTVKLSTTQPSTSDYLTIDVTKFSDANSFAAELVSKLNSTGTVSAYYDSTLGKLLVTTKQTGLIELKLDTGGDPNLSDLTVDSRTQGTNAEVSINDLARNVAYLNLKYSRNSFNFLGMVITLNKDTTGATVGFTVSKDIDAIVNNVKDFINKYNDLVSKIYSKITEKRNRDYPPLTEDQKAQMKEEDIKKWEEAAKKGLLNNDPILSSFLNNIRYYLYKAVPGLPSSLDVITEAGIETFSYFESKEGKLYIRDEGKLREAISNNLDAFVKLFTYTDSDPDTPIENQGILQRFYKLANDTLKKIYDTAGKPYFTNYYDPNSYIGKQLRSIADQMNAEQERLKQIEDRYYRQFTQLERLIAQMNTQSSWLSQQFSGK
ncbi:flagellar filament capping protein FliD [Caldicellulosiruptor sp. F32]|uniref:flagellar filament capping protein FliD n=1 Tax=Caldicellulosiruptor sp. F32 TaxID=1214564 RepID=UPI0003A19E0E|nr:flagellar filament capping protein FliD [Caldicellulosiruptor sp. F32]